MTFRSPQRSGVAVSQALEDVRGALAAALSSACHTRADHNCRPWVSVLALVAAALDLHLVEGDQLHDLIRALAARGLHLDLVRSEERRVGKECRL